MPKGIIKKLFVKNNLFGRKYFRIFGQRHLNPNLWHLNRFSVSRAFAIGLFTAFLPIPFQMVFACGLAIMFQGNLPVSVVLVWVTNPLTIGPIFYFAYHVGSWILVHTPRAIEWQTSWKWLSAQLGQSWQPLIVGLLFCGLCSALIGNLLIRIVWQSWVVYKWRARAKRQNRFKTQN